MTIIILRQCAHLIGKQSFYFVTGLIKIPLFPTFVLKRESVLFITRNYSTYYDTLGMPRTATVSSIKKAYYVKCKQYHPDSSNNAQDEQNNKFLKVQTAYQVLKSTDSRKQYDAYLQSVENTQYDFTEWKSQKLNTYEGERDYTKYRTTPPPTTGVDAKWSDFTWRDYVAFLFLVFFGVYVVHSELKASKVRHRKYYRRIDIQPPKTKSHHESKKSFVDTDPMEPAANLKNNKGATSQEKQHNFSKQSKKIKCKKNVIKKEATDPFNKIKSSGIVTDQVLQNLESSSKKTKSQASNNLTTW